MGKEKLREDVELSDIIECPPDITRKQYNVFCNLMEGKTHKLTSRLTGVPEQTIYKWKRKDWFKRMQEEFTDTAQRSAFMRLTAHGDDVVDGLLEIARGDDKEDRTAGARVKLGQVFFELGKNPILQKNPQLNINHTTNNNTLVMTPEKLGSLTEDELIEYNLAGVIPSRLDKEPEVKVIDHEEEK